MILLSNWLLVVGCLATNKTIITKASEQVRNEEKGNIMIYSLSNNSTRNGNDAAVNYTFKFISNYILR